MNITNQEQLALLSYLKKKANILFDEYVGNTILFENKTLYKRNTTDGIVNQYSFWYYKTVFEYQTKIKNYKQEIIKRYGEKQGNEIFKKYLQELLLKSWFSTLIATCSVYDAIEKKYIPYDNEALQLIKKAYKNNKLMEVVKWGLFQLTAIINNILQQENQALINGLGIGNYNINSAFKRLYTTAKKKFKENISIRYDNEKNRLNPKKRKYKLI